MKQLLLCNFTFSSDTKSKDLNSMLTISYGIVNPSGTRSKYLNAMLTISVATVVQL